MKIINYSGILVLSLFISNSVFAQIPVPTAEQQEKFERNLAGSVDEIQAINAATAFLKLIYEVDNKSIKFDAPTLQGDRFTVKAAIPGRSCNLALARNATANKYGWVIQEHNCQKIG